MRSTKSSYGKYSFQILENFIFFVAESRANQENHNHHQTTVRRHERQQQPQHKQHKPENKLKALQERERQHQRQHQQQQKVFQQQRQRKEEEEEERKRRSRQQVVQVEVHRNPLEDDEKRLEQQRKRKQQQRAQAEIYKNLNFPRNCEIEDEWEEDLAQYSPFSSPQKYRSPPSDSQPPQMKTYSSKSKMGMLKSKQEKPVSSCTKVSPAWDRPVKHEKKEHKKVTSKTFDQQIKREKEERISYVTSPNFSMKTSSSSPSPAAKKLKLNLEVFDLVTDCEVKPVALHANESYAQQKQVRLYTFKNLQNAFL